MIVQYECIDCPYCNRTDNAFVCWCTYWQKVVRIGEGCTHEERCIKLNHRGGKQF